MPTAQDGKFPYPPNPPNPPWATAMNLLWKAAAKKATERNGLKLNILKN